jgi:hypothetical protein
MTHVVLDDDFDDPEDEDESGGDENGDGEDEDDDEDDEEEEIETWQVAPTLDALNAAPRLTSSHQPA